MFRTDNLTEIDLPCIVGDRPALETGAAGPLGMSKASFELSPVTSISVVFDAVSAERLIRQ
jgi:hypothetical protein